MTLIFMRKEGSKVPLSLLISYVQEAELICIVTLWCQLLRWLGFGLGF